MILSDQEVEARLSSSENLLNRVQIIEKKSELKQKGDTEVPSMVRSLLASLSINSEESDKAIGSVFGVSQPTVSNSARGLIGDRKDEELTESVTNIKKELANKTDQVHNLALDSIMASLALVPAKIADESNDLRDLTRTAKDLSSVITNIERNKANQVNLETNNTLVVLHSTNRRKEANYEVLDV